MKSLQYGHPRIIANSRVQLPVADVQRNDVASATLQQTIREPTGAGTGIEYSQTRDIEPKRLQRCVQLLATTADESGGRAGEYERVPGVNLSRSLVGDRTVDENAASGNGTASVGSALHQLSTDKFRVKTLTPRHS